jgi:hypothetical protein
MPAAEEAHHGVEEWQRAHGHDPESVYLALTYGNALDPSLTHDDMTEAAGLWLEYQSTLRAAEVARRLDDTNHAEQLAWDIARFTQRRT